MAQFWACSKCSSRSVLLMRGTYRYSTFVSLKTRNGELARSGGLTGSTHHCAPSGFTKTNIPVEWSACQCVRTALPADPQEKSTRQKLSGGRLLGQCRKYNAAWRSRRTARWATQLCCLTRRLGPRVDAIDQFPVVSSVLTPFFWRSTGRGREGWAFLAGRSAMHGTW
jgi:hypothetical protein